MHCYCRRNSELSRVGPGRRTLYPDRYKRDAAHYLLKQTKVILARKNPQLVEAAKGSRMRMLVAGLLFLLSTPDSVVAATQTLV